MDIERGAFSQFFESLTTRSIVDSHSALSYIQNNLVLYAIWYGSDCYGVLNKSQITNLQNCAVSWAKLYNSLSRLSCVMDVRRDEYDKATQCVVDELSHVEMIICEKMDSTLWQKQKKTKTEKACLKDAIKGVCNVIKYTKLQLSSEVYQGICQVLCDVFSKSNSDVSDMFHLIIHKSKLKIDAQPYQQELLI